MKLRALGILVLVLAATAAPAAEKKKMFVLGVDGLDPKLVQYFMDKGDLPHIKKLVEEGDFKPLTTSMPPLSPVAWSNFITGMDPGGHGIFDFIHRDPETLLPYESMAGVDDDTIPDCCDAAWNQRLKIGKYCLPFKSAQVINLRQGKAFFEWLEESGVSTTIFKMPANYPPTEHGGKAISGMGTPDLLGTPGTFSFYTTNPPPNARTVSGGKVYPVRVNENVVKGKLFAVENPLICEPGPVRRGGAKTWKHPKLEAPFEVFIDPEKDVAKIVLGEDGEGDAFILEAGEWSEWQRVDFDLIPNLQGISGIGRFYLRSVRPEFELYVTPLQINPEEPAQPISTPDSWATDLYKDLGYFYTQGLPADTKAAQEEIFSHSELWDQVALVYSERQRQLDYFLDNFNDDFMFFYFSSVDQGTHMLWHFQDEEHPGFDREGRLEEGVRRLYRDLDGAVGRIRAKLPEDATFVIMSDHGFAPFYWSVNLNTWLLEKGYITLKDPARQGRGSFFSNVDWKKTKAYGLGLNGLYINQRNREKNGIVSLVEKPKLLDQLEKDLLEFKDPRNGRNVVSLVLRPGRDFSGEHVANDSPLSPDLMVGYDRGYRVSWKSPLGEFPKEVITDNMEAWSGDHSMDYRQVPGTLISNRKISMDAPALFDLTVAILDEYGIEKPEEMIGQDCLADGP
ncbi:hypothetical protein ABI59_09785 [Acidobacteria bacterium Mor1]|nr:hypothetical protein ABI59_09785 [Acidobacteria bacterium Mor1]